MSEKKIHVGILCGGKSAEHEVSLQSAKNVLEAIDRSKYDVTIITIDKSGTWQLSDQSQFLADSSDPKSISLSTSREKEQVALLPQGGGNFFEPNHEGSAVTVQVIFPILHGPYGEDGTVQGLLKLANVPFVGSGVLGSAVGMDKDVMKRLLRDAGIPVGRFIARRQNEPIEFEVVKKELGLPLFIKPANLGSSVGVKKVKDKSEFDSALINAFQFDRKVLIEEYIEGRELECAVLGNDDPQASGVGEVLPKGEFYSYEAKYLDPNGAAIEIPANISNETLEKIRKLAILTYKILECEGLGRIDFFLKEDGSVLVNEINTMPGFTKISMYPKLWEASGISYPKLINKLIELAIERFNDEKKLKTSRD